MLVMCFSFCCAVIQSFSLALMSSTVSPLHILTFFFKQWHEIFTRRCYNRILALTELICYQKHSKREQPTFLEIFHPALIQDGMVRFEEHLAVFSR